jgi:phosphonate transport system ATP-binding protein
MTGAERNREAAVEVCELALRRGDKLLFEKMSWRLPRGKFLAVTGVSGTGKSSLLACLGGALAPAAGTRQLSGGAAQGVGFVFQDFRLSANLSLLTNVMCGALGAYRWWQTLLGPPPRERRRAYALLEELGLADLAHRPARKVSGGELQRAAVARTLLQAPPVILADEPTANLDAELARRVLELLRRQCAAEECAVVAVLHNAELVAAYADCELRLEAARADGWEWRE